jgi:CheY-like chemotaxis protein
MSEGFQQRLFGKFAQEESESNRKYEGTGLGLTIARELITLMGGDISVRSKRGSGTTFTIELTLPKGNPANLRQVTGSIQKNAFAGRHILLVEDNDMNRFIALQSLHHFGFKVDEAVNGKQAVEMAARTSYDLILMDIQMPEMDGVQATGIILNELKQKVPIIALTANAFRHDIERYLNAGMLDYVTKPYSEEELFGKLRLYLNFSDPKQLAGQQADKESTPTSPSEQKNGDGSQNEKLFDTSGLIRMSQGDEVFVEKMIDMFVMLADRTASELIEELQQGNFAQLNRIAHRIKPSLENMGVHILAQPIRELESYPFDGDASARELLVAEITEVLRKVSSQIKGSR